MEVKMNKNKNKLGDCDYGMNSNQNKDGKMFGGLEEDRKIIQKKDYKYGPEGYWGI